jgi:DNA-binding NarL/FixJ family response regulator
MSAVPGVQRVDSVTHGDELLLRYELRPAALVLIGVHRGEAAGVENTRRLLAAHPQANTLVFGSAADTAGLATAIATGARGCLRWDASEPGSLTSGPGSGGAVGLLRADSHVRLTERELQVLHGMAQGKSNGEIGRELYLSEDTVKTHARRLFRALGVHDRAEAVAHGIRRGFVS